VTARGSWTRVFVDSERCLVYGPSLGRLYLLDARHALDRNLQRLLGLRSLTLRDDLPDPASRIAHDLSNLKVRPFVVPPDSLRIAYRLLHISRHLLPLRMMAAMVRGAAKRAELRPAATVSDIGRLVHGIERAVGLADCYPRALITTYLCLKSGHSCELVVGTLAPTRKMHAWCSIDGQIPYEASPEHYMYQPLMVVSLAP
jgi:hypothetical protein